MVGVVLLLLRAQWVDDVCGRHYCPARGRAPAHRGGKDVDLEGVSRIRKGFNLSLVLAGENFLRWLAGKHTVRFGFECLKAETSNGNGNDNDNDNDSSSSSHNNNNNNNNNNNSKAIATTGSHHSC